MRKFCYAALCRRRRNWVSGFRTFDRGNKPVDFRMYGAVQQVLSTRAKVMWYPCWSHLALRMALVISQ